MFNSQAVARQVLSNCDISDARHAGLYSICGLALRLRDLYKWDTGTPPWEEKEPAEVLDWIGGKEDQWEGLVDSDYGPIDVNGHRYSPFDTYKINAALTPHGYFYGAGYGYSLKPTFFMAAVINTRNIDGIPVTTLGRELARDLMTLPALSQDGGVVLRTEAAALYLWDKILYINKSGRRALGFALDSCGISDHSPAGLRHKLGDILAICQETFVYHEIGEIRAQAFNRNQWRELVAAFPHTSVELLARSVKDLLADTGEGGPLRRMIDKELGAALGFYTAFLDGLVLELFPELRPAFNEFSATGNWRLIEDAAIKGQDKAHRFASEIQSIYQAGKQRGDLQWAATNIEAQLLRPLGDTTAAE